LEKNRIQCDFYDISKYRNGNATQVPLNSIASECFTKNDAENKTVFIWGDSHAQQLYSGLKIHLEKDWDILQVTSSGCKAKLNASHNKFDYCEKSNWFAYKTIIEIKPDIVLIAQDIDHDASSMRIIAEALENIGIKKVIFTGPTPHWRPDLPIILASKFYPNIPKYTYVGINEKLLIIDQSLKKEFSTINNATYISIIDSMCISEGCLVYIGNDVKAGVTSFDYGHLSPVASEYFAKNILVPLIKDSFK
jgi:hypothetical protein